MVTLIQVLAITGNKRKINKIIPAVCGGQAAPASQLRALCAAESVTKQPALAAARL